MAALFILSSVAAVVTGLTVNNRYIVLASGSFHPVAGVGSGWVRMTSQRSRQTIELIDIRMESRYQAEVRLIAASDALDSMTAESTTSRTLGILPAGARGAVFPIDPPADLIRFRAVMLWSAANHSNLLTAPLKGPELSHPGAK